MQINVVLLGLERHRLLFEEMKGQREAEGEGERRES